VVEGDQIMHMPHLLSRFPRHQIMHMPHLLSRFLRRIVHVCRAAKSRGGFVHAAPLMVSLLEAEAAPEPAPGPSEWPAAIWITCPFSATLVIT